MRGREMVASTNQRSVLRWTIGTGAFACVLALLAFWRSQPGTTSELPSATTEVTDPIATVPAASVASTATPLAPRASAPTFSTEDVRATIASLEALRRDCGAGSAGACQRMRWVCLPEQRPPEFAQYIESNGLGPGLKAPCDAPLVIPVGGPRAAPQPPVATAQTPQPLTNSGVSVGVNPQKHSPEETLRDCAASITACMMRTRAVDECVRNASICQSSTPWLGDPAGAGCCPAACVRTYRDRRSAGDDPSTALDAIFTSSCQLK